MDSPAIVTGAISSLSELGKDEAWLGSWLSEQPARLGLGELEVSDTDSRDGAPSFVALDDDRCFSVDVQLGEIEPSRGFGVLDNWARNRVRHPDKTHVAVLVTEAVGERYETTLQALVQHLPLVVVELQVWRGQQEAIVVPHIALASEAVDLSATPAARAAAAAAEVATPAHATAESQAGEATRPTTRPTDEPTDEPADRSTDEPADATADGMADGMADAHAEGAEAATDAGADGPAEADATDEADDAPENKDDTGVEHPWGLPATESDTSDGEPDGTGRRRLLQKIGS